MKNLKFLKIFGLKIKVVFKSLDEGALGLYHFEGPLIEIEKNQKGDKLDLTVLHELFHAAFDRSGLNQCNISHDAQELICEQFSKAVVENFKITPRK